MIPHLFKIKVSWIASLLIVTFLSMLSAKASAHDFEVDNLCYNITGDVNVEVTHGETSGSYEGEITIPETVMYEGKTYTVTAIGDNAFSECNSLTKVNIPETVTRIESEAFNICGSLASINIPDGVTYIGHGAFGRCNSLTSIKLPNSLKGIEDWTFFACETLSSVLIPESAEYIGYGAFEGCPSLVSIIIPKSVNSIDNAFGRCNSLSEIHVDEDNPSYSSYGGVLLDKSGKTLICVPAGSQGHFNIPETVIEIGSFAFFGCNQIKSVNIPESVTFIGNRAFQECGIISLEIPNSVTHINDAFFSCEDLTSITLPDKLAEIYGWTFFGCGLLTSIIIPESVTSIGKDVGISGMGLTFYDCGSLKRFISLNPQPPQLYGSLWFFHLDETSRYQHTLYVPDEAVEAYKSSDWAQYFGVIRSLSEQPCPFFELNGAQEDTPIKILPNESKSLSVKFEVENPVLGFQTDISLPEGFYIAEKDGKLDIEFVSESAKSTYILSAARLDEQNYRILAFSPNNTVFDEGDNEFTINLTATSNQYGGEILFHNTEISLDGNRSIEALDFTVEMAEFVRVSELTLSDTEIAINKNNTYQLNATITPEDAWIKGLNWFSSDPEVATVDENGLVTAVSKGNAEIFVAATDGSETSASSYITVTNYPLTLDIGEDITIVEHETLQLNPVFAPEDADEIEIEWTSANPDIAYVDENNLLHALKEGETEITASNEAAGLNATVYVTVTAILFGDSNDDGIVAIDDVMADVQYILEQNPEPFNFVKADINQDHNINIVDVTGTVGIILSSERSHYGLTQAMKAARNESTDMTAEQVELDVNMNGMLVLNLNSSDITGMQADIQLPDGISAKYVKMAKGQSGDHIVSFAQLGDNHLRFVFYSLSSSEINPEMPVIEVGLQGSEDFTQGYAYIYDAYSSNCHSQLSSHGRFAINVVSSQSQLINDVIGNDPCESVDVHTLEGITLKRNASKEDLKALGQGIYIIGTKKVIIK